MNDGISITPEELYYLGSQMEAKYIDYAYIACIDDLGENKELFEGAQKESLSEKGLLSEDFSGNALIEEDCKHLLEPVFFGVKESSINVVTTGDSPTMITHKYHFGDNLITDIRHDEGNLSINETDSEKIRDSIKKLFGAECFSNDKRILHSEDYDNAERVIVVKKTTIGKESIVKGFVIIDGILYRINNDDSLESLPQNSFIEEATNVLL